MADTPRIMWTVSGDGVIGIMECRCFSTAQDAEDEMARRIHAGEAAHLILLPSPDTTIRELMEARSHMTYLCKIVWPKLDVLDLITEPDC